MRPRPGRSAGIEPSLGTETADNPPGAQTDSAIVCEAQEALPGCPGERGGEVGPYLCLSQAEGTTFQGTTTPVPQQGRLKEAH